MQKSKVSSIKGPQESHSRSFSLSGSTRLSNPPKKVEKSYEELVMEKEISAVEKARLYAVFEYLCSIGQNDTQHSRTEEEKVLLDDILQSFSATNLAAAFQQLDYYIPRHEMDMIIWEVDEDGDGVVTKYEFELMYKRCIFDKTQLEPRNLFNMVQFLMYDKSMKGKITVEDTLELLYVRVGRYNLDKEIYSIFGQEEKTADGQEKAINFKEYLEKMRRKDFTRRKELEVERKTVKPPVGDEK